MASVASVASEASEATVLGLSQFVVTFSVLLARCKTCWRRVGHLAG